MKKNSFLLPLGIFLFVYIALSALSFFYFQHDKDVRIDLYLRQQIHQLRSEYIATKNTYEKLSRFTTDLLIAQKEFLALLKEKNRALLYTKLLSYYNVLKRYNIHYFAILDEKGHLFLDLQKPQKKHKRGLFTTKSELLIEFSTPVFYKDHLIATLFTAISYNALATDLKRVFHNYYTYIVDVDNVSKNIFNYGRYLFIQSDLHPKYYYEYDKEHNQPEEIHLLNRLIAPKIKSKLERKQSFAIHEKINGKNFIITFLPIRSQNKMMGYLVSYKEDATAQLFFDLFIYNLIISNIIILAILITLFLLLRSKSKLEEMATKDKLTGVYNRHKFYEIAEKELARAKRTHHPFSIIIFDIDHFKKINDTYGHDIGDIVLMETARLISENIRKSDYFFRWGGEEFIILAPETDKDQAYILAEKLRELIASHTFEKVGTITISLGVTQFKEEDATIEEIVKRADEALYMSKENGRNRTTIL